MRPRLHFIIALSIWALILISYPLFAFVPNDPELKSFDVEKAIESNAGVNLSKYGASIRYIALDDSDIMLSPHPRMQVIHSANDVITLSHTGSNACTQFSGSDGKYIRSFIQYGRSSKEYINIGGIATSEDGNLIALLDYTKILIYSSKGEFVKSIPLDFTEMNRSKGLAFIGKNHIFLAKEYSKNYEHHGFIIDFNGNLLHSRKLSESMFVSSIYDKTMGTYRITTADQIYINCGQSINLATQLTDTLYNITPKLEKMPYAYMDFGKYRGKSTMDDERNLRGVTIRPTDYAGCNRFFILKVMIMPKSSPLSTFERMIYLLFDKESGEIHSMKYNTSLECWGMKNDIDNGAPFLPRSIVGNKMYQIIDAITFMDLASKCNSLKMKEVATKLTEESNPVLVEVTLK